MAQYKLYLEGPERTPANGVMRVEDGALIPFSLDNRDYQAYLKWLEEGNTPLPADEPTA
jgi:hypothetical protein